VYYLKGNYATNFKETPQTCKLCHKLEGNTAKEIKKEMPQITKETTKELPQRKLCQKGNAI